MEIFMALISPEGPVRPAALAGWLMVERSTLSRNLALMHDRGWVTVAETPPRPRPGNPRAAAMRRTTSARNLLGV